MIISPDDLAGGRLIERPDRSTDGVFGTEETRWREKKGGRLETRDVGLCTARMTDRANSWIERAQRPPVTRSSVASRWPGSRRHGATAYTGRGKHSVIKSSLP